MLEAGFARGPARPWACQPSRAPTISPASQSTRWRDRGTPGSPTPQSSLVFSCLPLPSAHHPLVALWIWHPSHPDYIGCCVPRARPVLPLPSSWFPPLLLLPYPLTDVSQSRHQPTRTFVRPFASPFAPAPAVWAPAPRHHTTRLRFSSWSFAACRSSAWSGAVS